MNTDALLGDRQADDDQVVASTPAPVMPSVAAAPSREARPAMVATTQPIHAAAAAAADERVSPLPRRSPVAIRDHSLPPRP